MRKAFIAVAASLTLALPAFASGGHAERSPPAPAVKLALKPEAALAAGRAVRVIARLTDAKGKPVAADALDTVHTQKFHLLVIDPTFTDYQHFHPQPTDTPGEYAFTFTPKLKGGYRAFADLTHAATGTQQFLRADMGKPAAARRSKTEFLETTVGNHRFILTFDGPLIAGAEVIGQVEMKPLTPYDTWRGKGASLEPVMGAFAHIVGFYDDYQTVLHTHPLGREPKSNIDVGGSTVAFHFTPTRPGIVKLFAQFRIDGKDVFAPFSLKIKAGTKKHK